MRVNIYGENISEEEKNIYIQRANEQHKGTTTLDIKIDGDYVDLEYHIQPFDRIRRMTKSVVQK